MGLHERWRSGIPLTGVLMPVPAPFLVEIAGQAGADFVVLDAEHGPGDASMLHHHIVAAAASGTAALVRVHPAETAAASRLIDLGAAGIFAPDVRSADQAREIVDQLHTAPTGERGFATGCSAAGWGLSDAARHAQVPPIVVAMIEHPDAVDAIAEISSVEGIDAVFVGRIDLAMAHGLGPEPQHATVRAAVDKVSETARSRVVGTHSGASIRLANASKLIADELRALLSR